MQNEDSHFIEKWNHLFWIGIESGDYLATAKYEEWGYGHSQEKALKPLNY